MSHPLSKLAGDRRGVVLVEFALVAPMLLLLLFGVIAYGSWLWRAHGLQQAANDAARAAIAGLTRPERDALARSVATSEVAGLGGIDPARTAARVSQDDKVLTVEIAYDGRADALLALPLVPLPDSIRRSATVRLGGL